MKISSSRLTTCSVARDGETVEIGLLDRSGMPVSVELQFDQAESVVMTLPQLLAWAVKRQTGNENARYVFHVSNWSVEIANNDDCLILTFWTTDGFEVSLGIPSAALPSLGQALASRGRSH